MSIGVVRRRRVPQSRSNEPTNALTHPSHRVIRITNRSFDFKGVEAAIYRCYVGLISNCRQKMPTFPMFRSIIPNAGQMTPPTTNLNPSGNPPGIEALGVHEGLSRLLDAPEPGQAEGFHEGPGRVVRQELPVAVVGQKLKRVQLVA